MDRAIMAIAETFIILLTPIGAIIVPIAPTDLIATAAIEDTDVITTVTVITAGTALCVA